MKPAASYPLVIAIIGAITGLTPLAIDMYLPAIPTIAEHFGTATERVQFSVSIYLLFFGIGQLLFGPITDALGRLKVMAAGLLLFALACLGCLWSQSIESLLVWRAVQALGGAATSVVAMGMIRDRFERDEFARAISFVMLVMQLAPLLAPILGGYLLLFSGWQSLFVVLAVSAVLMLIAVTFGIGETLPPQRRNKLSFANALATYAMILRHRHCMSYLLIGIMTAGTLFSFITTAPFVYIEYFGVAPQHFGYLFGLNIVVMMLCTSLNARYVARYGARKMLSIGLSIALVGALLLLLCYWLAPLWLWGLTLPVTLILGPLGLISANGTSLALEPFPQASGSVAALGGFLRFGWGALAGGVISSLHTGTPLPLVLMMASCSIIAIGIFLLQQRGTLNREQK
ncbi:Bcr/CflA family multidrug efflux MFS transporter [uncultured Ferrimonas sp.]|uniref:Bcr/CflA family multidrug efflux MFS transporter n=1 Tax=uncultured Ferrimonas sp. TaxID=432640 RepID=UPI00263902CD|nr:Bcr/CflA family multidrug efflux MFS transporter [uncultured Ferrimonas sp.]